MKTRLVLVATHYNNKILTKFANRKKCCLVLSLEDYLTKSDSCVERRREVLNWIFSHIEGLAAPDLQTQLEKIKEINICIDFNIGHSAQNFSQLESIINEIDSYEKFPIHFVNDEETLREVLKSVKMPVKLFLTGTGSECAIPIEQTEACRAVCKPMTSSEAISRFGYEGHKALDNLRDIRDVEADERSALLSHSLYARRDSTQIAQADQQESPCCKLIKKCCVIL